MKLQGETSLSSAFLEDILSLLFQGVKKKSGYRKFSCFEITSCRLDPVLFQAENEVMYFCSFQKLPLNYLLPPCVLCFHTASFLAGKPEITFVLL